MLGKLRFPIAGSRTVLALLLSIIFWGLAFGTPAQAAEVVTDTTAYPPGDTAMIDGYTFGSDETVTLQITHLDGTPLDGEPGEPWDVLSNSLGDFDTYWLVLYENVGETLMVVAIGQVSGDTATTTFLVSIGTNLDQLHNGTVTTAPAWSNGNININNSCYAEGDAVPFRYFVTKADSGTSHYFTIQMEWTKGGIHAYDYPNSYDATEDSTINLAGGPCGSVGTSPPGDCAALPFDDSLLFPDPTDLGNFVDTVPDSFPSGFAVDTDRFLKGYNCTIDSIGGNDSVYWFTGTSSDRELNLKVYFTTAGPTDSTHSVGLYWGGHMAEGTDDTWGIGNGAASVSGAPYHMRAIDFDDGGAANQDRSIQTGVICLPPDATIVCDIDALCADISFTYVCRDVSDANTWTWTVINGTIVGDNTLDSVVYYVNPGEDSVIVIVEACDNTGGCPGDFCCGEDSVTLAVNDPPVCDITGDTIVCFGFTTELCATAGMAAYFWSGPGIILPNQQCQTVGAGLAAGTYLYEVIITDDNGCADTCSTTLVVNDPPVCDITGDTSICVDFTTELCATAGMAAYFWSGPGIILPNQQCQTVGAGLAAGTYLYEVIITDDNGCADTCSTTLVVSPNPDLTCEGDDLTCDSTLASATVTVNNPGDLGTLSYNWTPDPVSGDGTNHARYDECDIVKVVVTDLDTGCKDSCEAIITCDTVRPSCNVSPEDTTIFDGESATFCVNPSGGKPPYTYSWTGPNSFTSSDSCITVSDSGLYQVIVTGDNGCADTCQATLHVITILIKWDVVIENKEKVIQGTHEKVKVTVTQGDLKMGGFDFLIAYDASALNFIMAIEGDLYGPYPPNCEWEYFTYRFGAFGNCGNACPSGLLRVVGIAETNNGPVHPACFRLPVPYDLFYLDFLVTDDRTFECMFIPIRFFWMDCGDNVISSKTGDTLWVDSQVFDKGLPMPDPPDDIYHEITNHYYGWPTYFGMQEEPCMDDTAKHPIRYINFYNGGIDIVCAESLDARGDINLNGVSNEVADAVLFSNYFIYGLGVFHINFDGQIAATDVNADGLVLSVGDLVYQIRIIVGDAQPYPKLSPVTATFGIDKGVVSVDKKMGAALVVVEGDVIPTLLADNMDIKYAYNAEENVTRVLVYSFEGNGFSGEFLNANGNVVSIELGSYEGAVVKTTEIPANFALNQNYPNPFNPVTIISFNLPVASEYTLTVYNVTGQMVTQYAGEAEAGTVSIEWNASDMASGVYFYRLHAGEFAATKKMLLLK